LLWRGKPRGWWLQPLKAGVGVVVVVVGGGGLFAPLGVGKHVRAPPGGGHDWRAYIPSVSA
jgi:hypothetical protein